jgi:predicted secreted protein
MSNHAREIILITGGVISTLCSGSVVLTGVMFSKTMLSRTHPFSNMIFFISLCDMIGSVAMSFGYPHNYEIHCKAQSFLLFFCFPASWLWTTCLVYQLRSMMFYKKLHLSMFTLHCICWCTALLVALLPLSENTYGEDDDLEGRSVCYLQSSHKQRKFWWLFGLFYGVLLVCVVLMVYWMAASARQIRAMRHTTFTDYKERAIYKATRWYPLGLLLTWSLSIVVTILLAIYSDVEVDYIQAGQIAQTQYGTVLALIFFSNSKIVRHRWKELYRKVFKRVLPHALSADTQSLDRASEESLDPEGMKFSSDASLTEGPRLSEIAHILSFGVLNASSQASSSRGRRDPSDDSGSNDVGEETAAAAGGSSGGIRVSTYVRDWLVNSAKERTSGVEMSSPGGSSRRESSTSPVGRGKNLGDMFSFGSKTGNSNSRSGSPRSASSASSTSGITERGTVVASPLAAALERARTDRDREKEAGSNTSTGTGHATGGVDGAVVLDNVEV